MNIKREICLLLILTAAVSDGYSPSVTNEVVGRLVAHSQVCHMDRLKCAPDDGVPLLSCELRQRSYDDLFTGGFAPSDIGFNLTSAERQSIFESFLLDIPNLSTNRLFSGLEICGTIALGYCKDHDHTNSLNAAKRILSSPYSECQGIARELFEKFAIPSEETYRFVESVMTNRGNGTLSSDHAYLLGSFANVLVRHRGAVDPETLTNSIRLVHRSVADMEGRNTLDRLLREFVSDYAVSSNRLTFAIKALDANVPPGFYGQIRAQCVRSTFIPITNALLNASEPLKVLDLSWLDEQSTNNERETEHQEENNE